uniref:Uncharacterized protein n=1 Tax=Fagus sylvatica TaxID=28930 RepID=A0A2N9HHX5_FAGSY
MDSIRLAFRIETKGSGLTVKKCGFRLVYMKDIADLKRTMGQSSNNLEDNKIKRSLDDYDGTGPSREGSFNDVPHPKWNLWPMVNLIVRSQVSMRNVVRSSVIVISDLGFRHWEKSSESDLEAVKRESERERDSRPELRKEEVEQSRADPLPFTESRDTRRAETESRAETELTGGGGSERQRVEERESGAETKRREIEWLRKVREKIFKFEIYAKRRRFGSPRGPDPTGT